MMKSLRSKLILSFSVLILLAIGALSIAFNYSVDDLFQQYAYAQQEKQINQIIGQVNAQYMPESRSYNIAGLEVIGNAALQSGIMVHVQSISKELDWDISMHKAQECQLMLQHADKNMHTRYPNFGGGLEQKQYDLFDQGVQVGYLTLGFYGPYSFSEVELNLLESLNKLIIGLGIFCILLAALFGSYIASHLTKPLRSVVVAAKNIAQGNYGTQITEKIHTTEISTLIAVVNEMSSALQMKDQQKRQLTADVAHELRTPLSNLQSHMEAMIDAVWEPTPELFQSCHDEILRLTGIVNQLQELTQLENGEISLEKDRFSISELFTWLQVAFYHAAQEKGITLLLDPLPESALLFADKDRIKQCMINLISNALRATPSNGSVKMQYRQDDDHDYLDVIDTGVGIPPQELTQLFERFYRVDKSRAQRTGGMGIGLSITKAIVLAHGGEITVDSQVGSGSTFTITLPKCSE